MEFPLNSSDWWDMKGEKYLRNGDYRERFDEFLIASREAVGSVMEIGPAFGRFAKFVPSRQYIGIDISARMTQLAREQDQHHIFITADFLNLDAGWHGAVDTVVAFQFLEHFERPEQVVALIKKVARRRFVFSVPRGPVHPSAYKNDGHLIGWEDETEMASLLQPFGSVSFWQGADNHICGTIVFERTNGGDE